VGGSVVVVGGLVVNSVVGLQVSPQAGCATSGSSTGGISKVSTVPTRGRCLVPLVSEMFKVGDSDCVVVSSGEEGGRLSSADVGEIDASIAGSLARAAVGPQPLKTAIMIGSRAVMPVRHSIIALPPRSRRFRVGQGDLGLAGLVVTEIFKPMTFCLTVRANQDFLVRWAYPRSPRSRDWTGPVIT
jgi:hypothetical protein